MIHRILRFSIFIFSVFFIFKACQPLGYIKYLESTKEYKITWDGYERNYFVHFPPKEKMNKPVPLLFHLHGGGGTAEKTPAITFGRFNELADRDGFIVVYPNAIEKNWNDGRKSDDVKSWKEDIDDVGFIIEIIDELKTKYKIDEQRIFTTGMSNGGFMSGRLACDRADVFRGAAILTAQISKDYLPSCNPSQPLGIMVMNGTEDKLVPYDGGVITIFKKTRGEILSTDEFIEFWKKNNNCTSEKTTVNLPNKMADGTTVSIEEYSNCDNRGALKFYKIKGGGHTWPGGKQYLREKWIGKTSREINACEEIWDFFKSL